MIKRGYEFIVILSFILITIFIFRSYFIKNTVPFPANLLVSFYQPFLSHIPPVANKAMGFDNLRIYYPLRDLSVRKIKNKEFPLWNPYAFSGNTLLATYQSAIFHPLSPLFLILPIIDAWSIIIIILPILSSFFTYLFFKDLGISRRGAFLGGLAFAFSGYSVVWWEESFMSISAGIFLPLALLGINKIFKEKLTFGFLLLLLSLTFSILSGWFQVTLYVFLFSFIWAIFLFVGSIQKLKSFSLTLLAYPISGLLSGIHLIPSLEAYLYSPRGNTDAKYIFDLYFLQKSDLIKILFPDFYGNPGTYNYFSKGFYYETTFFIAVPLLLLAFYAFLSMRKSRTLVFFMMSFLICLSLAFSLPSSWFLLYKLKIPILSTILPSRILLLSTFSLSAGVAFGWDYFIKNPELKKITIIGMTLLSVIVFISFPIAQNLYFYKDDPIYLAGHQSIIVSLRNMLLPGILILLTIGGMFSYRIFKRGKYVVFATITALSLINIFYFTSKYLYFSEKKYVYPDLPALKELKKISGLNRVWGFKNARIENNFATYYQLYSPEGYDSIYIKRYGELFHAAKLGGVYSTQIPRTDANLVTNDYEEGIDKNLYRKKLMQLLGVRYVLENKNDVAEHKDTNVYKPVWNDDTFTIFEYTDAYPRTFLVDEYKTIKEPEDLIKTFFDPRTDLQKTMLLEETPKIEIDSTNLIASSRITMYSPNKVHIDIESNKNSLLFLSDPYFPGWNAYIDRNPSKTYRANFAFRALEIPKGKHKIEFIYQPRTFTQGIIVSAGGIIITTFIVLLLKKKEILT